jgi:hypothetical protein
MAAVLTAIGLVFGIIMITMLGTAVIVFVILHSIDDTGNQLEEPAYW